MRSPILRPTLVSLALTLVSLPLSAAAQSVGPAPTGTQIADNATVSANHPPSAVTAPSDPETSAETGNVPALTLAPLKPPKVTMNQISASGDFFYGSGTVTLPLFYSLQKSLGAGAPTPTVAKPTRTSDYIGGTISYSYGQAWFIDLSYAHGHSSGNQNLNFQGYGEAPTAFTIDDDWYQAYLRYAFPALRGKRLSAYLRAGASYVKADLTDDSQVPVLGLYHQSNTSKDILGNLGFGAGYSLYAGRRFSIGLLGEGEGFFGYRSQDTTETLQIYSGLPTQQDTINNTLYGGIGRGTAHFEYRLGQSGTFKIFSDGGVQVKYTRVEYPSGVGTFDELLWGPYVKLGLSWSF